MNGLARARNRTHRDLVRTIAIIGLLMGLGVEGRAEAGVGASIGLNVLDFSGEEYSAEANVVVGGHYRVARDGFEVDVGALFVERSAHATDAGVRYEFADLETPVSVRPIVHLNERWRLLPIVGAAGWFNLEKKVGGRELHGYTDVDLALLAGIAVDRQQGPVRLGLELRVSTGLIPRFVRDSEPDVGNAHAGYLVFTVTSAR